MLWYVIIFQHLIISSKCCPFKVYQFFSSKHSLTSRIFHATTPNCKYSSSCFCSSSSSSISDFCCNIILPILQHQSLFLCCSKVYFHLLFHLDLIVFSSSFTSTLISFSTGFTGFVSILLIKSTIQFITSSETNFDCISNSFILLWSSFLISSVVILAFWNI